MNEDGREFRFDLNNIEAFFKEMSAGRHLHSKEVYRLMNDANRMMDNLKVCETIKFTKSLYILGDLHGSLPDFKNLFTNII